MNGGGGVGLNVWDGGPTEEVVSLAAPLYLNSSSALKHPTLNVLDFLRARAWSKSGTKHQARSFTVSQPCCASFSEWESFWVTGLIVSFLIWT